MAEVMGWICVHRQLQDHWLWEDKPYSFGQAWIDMLLLANHADNKFPLGKEIITVPRGSFITSELKLMDRWGWSKTKVRRFLELLESDSMIIKKADNKKTTITIENYRDFQDLKTTEEQQKDIKKTSKEHQKNNKKTSKEHQKDTNNNDNNDNNYINKGVCQKVVDLYNTLCPSFPKIKKLSDARKKAIKARLNTYTLDDFEQVFRKAEASDFLKGSNNRNWSANFDWLIKDSSMAKVLDDNYINKPKQQSNGRKEVVPSWMDKPSTTRNYDMDDLEKKLFGGNKPKAADDP